MLQNISLPYTPAPRQQALVPVRRPNQGRYAHQQEFHLNKSNGLIGKILAAATIVAVATGLSAFIVMHGPTVSIELPKAAVASIEVPAVQVMETARPRTVEVAAPVVEPPVAQAQLEVSLPANVTVNEAPVVSTQGDGPIKIRLGPGTGYNAIGKLNDGEDATVIGRSVDNYWWKVSYQGQTGWISAAFVKFSGDPTTVPMVSDQPLLYTNTSNPATQVQPNIQGNQPNPSK